VDPRAVMDAVVKRKIPTPCRESNPRTPIVQLVAQRYTDRAMTALFLGPNIPPNYYNILYILQTVLVAERCCC
jgi:hypothetical protein